MALASLRRACGPETSRLALERSLEITNELLGRGRAVEVNVVAGGRLVLVHQALVPALYRLVRRGRALDDLSGLGMHARRALAFIGEHRGASAGDVRRHLGLALARSHDPVYEALADLQRALLVDRGPFAIPKRGIPYLPPGGYPYRIFAQAHTEAVVEAGRWTIEAAADAWLGVYVRGAGPQPVRTLTALFKAFLDAGEIRASLERLDARGPRSNPTGSPLHRA